MSRSHKVMSRRRIGMVIILSIISFCYINIFSFAETILNLDSSDYHGDFLGNNVIQDGSDDSVYIICKEIYLHEEPVDSSARLKLLTYDQEGKLIKYTDDWLQTSFEFMENEKVISVTGWVKTKYCAIGVPFYIAMHPTPVLIAPRTNALIIHNMNTYDSLRILYEIDDFYCVSINEAVGFVEKD